MSQAERERRHNISRNVICCLYVKSSETCENICNRIKQLRCYCIQSVYTFDDLNICIDFLTDIDENGTIYLVIAEPIDEQVLSLLKTLNSIKLIYMVHSGLFIGDTVDKICSQIEKDARQ